MISWIKNKLYRTLRSSERYTKTDMVYLARGNFWLFAGRIIASGSGLLLTLMFANLLTPEAFGTYKYILAIAGAIAALTLNGLGNALLRAIGKGYQNVVPSVFKSGLLWSIPASIVAFSGSAYYLFKGNETLGWSLAVIALLNPLLSTLGVSKSFFVATGDFRRATFYNTIRTVAQIGVIMCALLLTDNILIITTTFFCVSAIVGYITYWHSLKVLDVQDDSTQHDSTMRYAKHMSVLGFLQLGVSQLDQLLLWHFAGPVALATYAIALGPTRELRSVSENISALALPKLAEKSRENAADLVRAKSRYLLVIYLGIAIFYAISAPFIFTHLFPQYLDAILPSQILAFGLVFQSRSLADLFLFSHGGVKDRYRAIIPSQITRAILYVILIPLYGLYGAVFAVILAEVANLLAVVYAYRANKKENSLVK